MKRIEIDFESIRSYSGGQKISIGSGHVYFRFKKPGFWASLGRPTFSSEDVSLHIDIGDISTSLKFRNPDSIEKFVVFQINPEGGGVLYSNNSDKSLNYQSQYFTRLDNVFFSGHGMKRSGLDAVGFTYNLFLDLSQIEDYSGTDKDIHLVVKFQLNYTPTSKNLNDVEKSDYTFPLHLLLRPAKSTGILRLEVDKSIQENGAYYRSTGNARIGLLRIDNTSNMQFSYPLSATICVSDMHSSIVLDTLIEGKNGLILSKIQNTELLNVIGIKNLLRGESIAIPVLLNFDKLPITTNNILVKEITAENQSIDVSIEPDTTSIKILPSRLSDEIIVEFENDVAFENGLKYTKLLHTQIGVVSINTRQSSTYSFPLDFEIDIRLSDNIGKNREVYCSSDIKGISEIKRTDKIIKLIFKEFKAGNRIVIPIAIVNTNIYPTQNGQIFDLLILFKGGGREREILTKKIVFPETPIAKEFIGELRLDDDFRDGYQYKPADNLLLGAFHLSRASSSICDYPLSASVDFGIIPSVSGGFEIIPKMDEYLYELTDKQNISIKHWEIGKELIIPALIHLTKFPENESEDQKYVAQAIVHSFDAEDIIVEQEFIIKQPKYPTQNRMSLLNRTGNLLIKDWCSESLPNPYIFNEAFTIVHTEEQSFILIFSIVLSNMAKHGDGHVWIDSLSANFGTSKEMRSYNNFFYFSIDDEIDNYPIEDLNQKMGFTIKDGQKSTRINFLLSQKDSLFNDDAAYEMNINCTLDCKYEIVEYTGSERSAKNQPQLNRSIEFTVRRSLGDHWLALDLGTSAIVAAFDDGNSTDVHLFDLQSTLKAYYLEEEGATTKGTNEIKDPLSELEDNENAKSNKKLNSGDYKPGNIREYDTKFLDSNIILRVNGMEKSMVWHEDIVHISAPIHEQTTSSFPVPYVKSLVGADYINKYNKSFDNFKYYKGGNLVESYGPNRISVKNILKNTYKIIFRDFILKKINDDKVGGKFNKIVATYPNTFSANHLNLIREVIESEAKIPNPNKNLIFISESDAVAHYYLANRKRYNKDRPEDKKFSITDDDKQLEYLLVYDMGAGTLDLTLMRIEVDTNSELSLRGKVEIVGRLGKNTAGNYFDYILAKALYCIAKKEDCKNVDASLKKADQLKIFIRDYLKPELNINKEETIKMSEEVKKLLDIKDDDITYQELLKHKFIEDYFEQNTNEVLDNFLRLISRDLQDSNSIRFPIHTVLISGRASQINLLRDKLKSSIDRISAAEGGAYIVSADYILADADSPEKNVKLKGIVAQGAIRHATAMIRKERPSIELKNKNVLASYGFLYGDAGQQDLPWLYEEMISPHTAPLQENPAAIKDGLWIYEYDVKRNLNLEGATVVKFIQSFAADTEKMFNNKKTEYITEIFSISTSEIKNQHNVPVRVRIDNSNRMEIVIGTEGFRYLPESPLAIDLFNSDTFKKSMWPYYDQD